MVSIPNGESEISRNECSAEEVCEFSHPSTLEEEEDMSSAPNTISTRTVLRLLQELFSHASCPINFKKAKTKDIYVWLGESPLSAAEQLRNGLDANHITRKEAKEAKLNNVSKNSGAVKSSSQRSMFQGENTLPHMVELGSEMFKHYLKLAISMELYGKEDPRTMEFYKACFLFGSIETSLLTGGAVIQKKWSLVTKTRIQDNFVVRSILPPFSVLIFFHSIMYCKKNLDSFKKNRQMSNRIGFLVHIICSTWDVASKKIGFKDCGDLLSPYVIFNNETWMFEPIEQPQMFAPLSQKRTILEQRSPTGDKRSVDERAAEMNFEKDKAIRHVVKEFFEHLHTGLHDSSLFEFKSSSRFARRDIYIANDAPENEVPLALKLFPRSICENLGWEHVGSSQESESLNDEEDEIQPNVTQSRQRRGRMRRKIRKRLPPSSWGVQKKQKLNFLDANRFEEVKRILLPRMEQSKLVNVFDSSYEEIDACIEESGGESLEGKVQLILTDPPYNIRREQKKTHSEHDKLAKTDMKSVVKLFRKYLRPGGHGIVFCSMVQFGQWLRALKKEESSKQYSTSEDEKRSRQDERWKVFGVEDIPLHFVRANGQYNSHPGRKGPSHLSIVEIAVHFWKRKKPSDEVEVVEPEYTETGELENSHDPATNCIDHVKLEKHEIVKRKHAQGQSTPRGKGSMLRPEQKSVALLRHLIQQYTKPGNIVLDLFGGTFSTARACLTVPNIRVFYGFENDKDCFNTAMDYLLLTFLNVFENRQDLFVGVESEKEEFTKHMEAVISSSPQGYKAPNNLPQYQTFPDHIIEFVAMKFGKWKTLKLLKTISYSIWPNPAVHALQSTDVSTLLKVDAISNGLFVSKSLIKHEDAGLGVFSTKKIQSKGIVCHFYGTILYSELDKDAEDDYSYGSGHMSVTKNRFLKYSMEIETPVTDGDGDSYKSFFICPAPFCVGGIINDPTYHKEDREYSKRNNKKSRKANVRVEDNSPAMGVNPGNSHLLQSHRLLTVIATRTIEIGEELYLSYGNVYENWKVPTTQGVQAERDV